MEVIHFKTRVGSDGMLRINIRTKFVNREMEVVVVMQPLGELDPRCIDMPIEDLGVSAQALDALRKSGTTIVGDLTFVLEQTWGGRAAPAPHAPYIEYIDEIVKQLKEIGCWPESLAGE
jgi:hypothetical protein